MSEVVSSCLASLIWWREVWVDMQGGSLDPANDWYAGEGNQEATEDKRLELFVHFYNLESKEEGVLWDVKPSYVIMYDPDMAFIRQIEVKLLTYALFLHPGMLMSLSRYKLARGLDW